MTQEQFDELQRLHEAARPWECIERGNVGAAHPLFIVPAKGDGFRAPSDAETKLIWEMRNALPALLSHVGRLEAQVADAAEAYEKRIRADERRKVHMEEANRLAGVLNAIEDEWRGLPKTEYYFGRYEELIDQRDYFNEQLAALEAEASTRNCGTSAAQRRF